MRTSIFDSKACECGKNGVKAPMVVDSHPDAGLTCYPFQWFQTDDGLMCPTCGGERRESRKEIYSFDDHMPTINDLADFAESIRKPWPQIGDKWKAPTGEKYVALCHHGIKAEGEEFPVQELMDSPEAAALRWKTTFALYVVGRPGTLYWRCIPIIERDNDRCGYVVYSRLLVSDKPFCDEYATEIGVSQATT